MWKEKDFEWANQYDPELDEMIKVELERQAIASRCREIAYDFRFLRGMGITE
jgi:hypothetical protein